MSWPVVPLGDVFEVQLGKMLDAKATAGEPRQYLANRNVQWGACDVSDLSTMRFTSADRARFSLRPDDLLVCEGGEVGRTAIWQGEVAECYFQKAVHRLRARRPNVLPRFALHYMRQAAAAGTFRHLTTSTSIAHLTKEKLEIVPFPLPPVPEQRRIADLLDRADDLLRKRREAQRLTDEFLRSAFLDIFGDPVANPKSWPTKPLGESIATIEAGWSVKGLDRPAADGEWGVLKISAVTTGTFLAGENKAVEQPTFVREAIVPRRGDLLFSRANTRELVAATCLVDHDVPNLFLPDKLWRLTPTGAATKEWLRFLLAHPGFRRRLAQRASGTSGSMLNVSQATVLGTLAPTPPLGSQQRFSNVVRSTMPLRATQVAAANACIQFAQVIASTVFETGPALTHNGRVE